MKSEGLTPAQLAERNAELPRLPRKSLPHTRTIRNARYGGEDIPGDAGRVQPCDIASQERHRAADIWRTIRISQSNALLQLLQQIPAHR